jgi:hypothetical protein
VARIAGEAFALNPPAELSSRTEGEAPAQWHLVKRLSAIARREKSIARFSFDLSALRATSPHAAGRKA